MLNTSRVLFLKLGFPASGHLSSLDCTNFDLNISPLLLILRTSTPPLSQKASSTYLTTRTIHPYTSSQDILAMPMFAQSPKATNAGNKRKRGSCSCTAPSPTHKQLKPSNIASPTPISPSEDAEGFKSRSSHANGDPSLKTILESHLATPLGPWLADLETRLSTTQQEEQLLPSTTYIYMQLDPEDPNSYACVPLPPLVVMQMTTLPTTRASSDPSMVKKNDVETLSPQITMKVSSSLQTPPQTPPQTSASDTGMAED
jgi:hypothetical protein